MHGEQHYYAYLASPLGDGWDTRTRHWLAVSGAETVDRRPVKMLPNVQDSLVGMIRSDLRKRGMLPSGTFRVTQNVEADLDRDGKSERLVTMEFAGTAARTVLAAAYGLGDGRLAVEVLAETGHTAEDRTMVRLLAVADINGDRVREVAVLWGIADGMGVDVFTFGRSGFRKVYEEVWGDA